VAVIHRGAWENDAFATPSKGNDGKAVHGAFEEQEIA
jgi:hypothetical protein